MPSSKKFDIVIRKKFYLVLFTPLIFVGLATAFWFWYTSKLQPVNQAPVITGFVIYKNESASSILDRLQTGGFIRSAAAAKIFLRLNNTGKKMSPGGFNITGNLSASEIIQLLSKGPQDIWITIPEGWRHEQIGLRFAATLTGPTSVFKLEQFLALSSTREGQLFPDTYLVPPDISTSAVISLLTNTFRRKTGLTDTPTDKQALLIASLIEREAGNDTDRGLISGIITKRLENDWPLQIDATIQYAADSNRCVDSVSTCDWWQPVTDTKVPSAYNTYSNIGLPPTPISNPGLASIRAAQNPVSSPYWYYLTGLDGITRYAATLAEHNANVDKYLKR